MRKNIVLDTNTYISGYIFRGSMTTQALVKAQKNYKLVFSEQT
jgi:predicted nucleic acid-binding protein